MSQIKYDAIYKKFFTHPAMIQALMRGFVPLYRRRQGRRGDWDEKIFRVLINSKFGETSPNLVEKLQFINGIDDICGVAQKVPSAGIPRKAARHAGRYYFPQAWKTISQAAGHFAKYAPFFVFFDMIPPQCYLKHCFA